MDAFFSEDILQLLLEPESSNLDLDALLLAALESYEDTHDTEAVPVPVAGAAETSHSLFASWRYAACRFAQPKTDMFRLELRDTCKNSAGHEVLCWSIYRRNGGNTGTKQLRLTAPQQVLFREYLPVLSVSQYLVFAASSAWSLMLL